MEKYLYTVNPRMPIRNVIPGQLITREANLSLDLDQVKACLKFGPVYRKFANANQVIQVTLENCERLHQRDYIQKIDAKSTFIPPKMEEIPKPVEVVETPVESATVEVEEPVVEESTPVEENVQPVDEVQVESTEEVEEAPVEESVTVEENVQPVEVAETSESPAEVETPVESAQVSAPAQQHGNYTKHKKYKK